MLTNYAVFGQLQFPAPSFATKLSLIPTGHVLDVLLLSRSKLDASHACFMPYSISVLVTLQEPSSETPVGTTPGPLPAAEEQEANWTCPICLNWFDMPVSPPCHHNFCAGVSWSATDDWTWCPGWLPVAGLRKCASRMFVFVSTRIPHPAVCSTCVCSA